jgi:hypothetical protein
MREELIQHFHPQLLLSEGSHDHVGLEQGVAKPETKAA